MSARVFIWYDEEDKDYAILGIFPTLEAAQKEASEGMHSKSEKCCCIYEEALYPEGMTIEPVYHAVPHTPR